MGVLVDQSLQEYVEMGKVIRSIVICQLTDIRLFAKRANAVADIPLGDLKSEVIVCALLAANVFTLEHGYHL